jgi:hypothetical protein
MKMTIEQKHKYDDAVERLKCIEQDFEMLMSGEWTPDDDSCSASLDSVDIVNSFINSLKPISVYEV